MALPSGMVGKADLHVHLRSAEETLFEKEFRHRLLGSSAVAGTMAAGSNSFYPKVLQCF